MSQPNLSLHHAAKSQNKLAACSPQTLSELQVVFDAIWQQLLSERSRLTFPWAVEASRFTIARLVLEHLNDSKDVARIKQDILIRLAKNGNR